jgi:hypothetical protein
MPLLLPGLLYQPGAETPSAETYVLSGSIHDDVMTCNVDLLAALTDVVSMAYLAADLRAPSAYLALAGMVSRHCNTSDAE